VIPPRTSIAWFVVAIVTVALAAAVYVVPMPEPKASIVIDRATLLTGAGPGEEVALPATLPARGGQADRQPDGPLRDIHYRAAFDLPDSPGDNLFVLIASLERPATVALNGHQIFDSGSQALWSGPLMATPVLLQLPGPMLVRGRNELTVETEAGLIVPTRLSRIYVGRASDLAPVFKLQSFLEQQLKTMAVVAHFILGVGILFLYFARPRDVLFAWLAGLVGVSFVLSTLVYLIFHPAFSGFARYVSTLMPVLGLCALGVALAVTDIVPPRVLKVAALVLPAISVPVAFLGGERVLSLLTVLDVALLIALAVVSAGVIAWGSFRKGNVDARIMLPPFFLVAWFLIHDGGVVAGLFGGSLLVISYSRPLILAAVTFVLMRRLTTTLGALDRSNDQTRGARGRACRLAQPGAQRGGAFGPRAGAPAADSRSARWHQRPSGVHYRDVGAAERRSRIHRKSRARCARRSAARDLLARSRRSRSAAGFGEFSRAAYAAIAARRHHARLGDGGHARCVRSHARQCARRSAHPAGGDHECDQARSGNHDHGAGCANAGRTSRNQRRE
jgi:hypothetical protein